MMTSSKSGEGEGMNNGKRKGNREGRKVEGAKRMTMRVLDTNECRPISDSG